MAWAIGNALVRVAGDEVTHEIVELVKEPRLGVARQTLAEVLGRTKSPTPEVVDALVGLLEDDQIRGHAIHALGKLKAIETQAAIAKYLEDSKAWVRKEARKALRAIEKASEDCEGARASGPLES